MKSPLRILLVQLASLAVASCVHSCPSYEVGSLYLPENEEDESIGTYVDVGTDKIFLNYEDPAECDGEVYGWQLCRARDRGAFLSLRLTEIYVGIFRRGPNGSLPFLINSTLISVRGEDFNYSLEYDRECVEIWLEESEYFRVETDDLVGACWEQSFIRGLGITAKHLEKSLTVYEADSCLLNNDDSISNSRPETTLLLSAYINVNECSLEEGLCHRNALCVDFPGEEDSYDCICKLGFTGDGFHSCIANNTDEPTEASKGTLPTTTNESSIPTDVKKSNSDGDSGGIVGAVVAAVLVALLIIAVIVALVMIYLSRRRIEKVWEGTIAERIARVSFKKRSGTASSGADGGGNDPTHDYDYVTVIPKPREESRYDQVGGRTPLPRLTTATQHYEIPLQSLQLETSLDQPLKNSPQYEVMLSTPSVALVMQKNAPLQGTYTSLIHRTMQEHVYEPLSPYQAPANQQESLYAQLSSYNIRNISRENLRLLSTLGIGQFGKVSKAVWAEGDKQEDVAVKTLTNSANTVKFLQEAAIMAQFRHPNILTLHGVVSSGDPKIIVFELMHNGDLKTLLTKMRPLPEEMNTEDAKLKLLDFSKQVALGLHYLSCRGFVHRDLAARNILVSKDHVCKIADFGLSRDLAIVEDDIYVSRGGKIPLKWCAPEAIFHRKYSTASDIWSYGCVLYEVWSLGHKPYEAIPNKQVMQLLKKGHRLPPPSGCPKMVYNLMIRTWHPKPSERPSSRDILKTLLKNTEEVLAIPPEDVPADSQAAVLGAPLDQATQLYQELQNIYIHSTTA